MLVENNTYGKNFPKDDLSLLKRTYQIISSIKELESKVNLLEDLILDLRNNLQSISPPKYFEPIRGIHGLAKFLGISPATAQKLKNEGVIPYSQFGRVVLFDPQKIMEALENKNHKK